MALRIHVLQHVSHEDPGSLASVFAAHDVIPSVTKLYDNDPLPASDAFDMLLVLGGPMNVYERERYPWLVAETACIGEALHAGKAVLGLCLGAQLMAVALGGRITRNAHREIGWWPVETLPDARDDARAACFPARFTTFHWHGDTFSLPPGAVPLFRSEGCAHQGFAWGPRAVGLQFHPEITAEAVEEWIAVAMRVRTAQEAQQAQEVQKVQKVAGVMAHHPGGGDLEPGPYVKTAAAMREAAGPGAGFVADNNRALERLFKVLTQGLPHA